MEQILHLINEMSPFLLLGFLLAGLMHAFIPGQIYSRYLAKSTFSSPDTPAARLSAPAADRLSTILCALPLAVTRAATFDESMVTSGGVSLKEVDPATLASRIVPTLHFAGEILDLDGPEGGWNLHWAFASGTLAGRSAARALQGTP